MTVAYEDRICLFLDFLGFSQQIIASETDASEMRRIASAIDVVRDQFTPLMHNGEQLEASKVVTQFSDSIVVSYAVAEKSAAFQLAQDTLYCLVRLAECGFLLRGAIVRGSLYHTSTHLFGPAMVSAYAMESKAAIYPRVIVQEGLIDAAHVAPAPHHRPEEEAGYVKRMLRRDFDGLLYIDYIGWEAVVDGLGGDVDQYPDYMTTLSDMIAKHVKSADFGIRAKYGWVCRHYMDVVKLAQSVPADSPFRVESPGVLETIENLPTFDVPGRIDT